MNNNIMRWAFCLIISLGAVRTVGQEKEKLTFLSDETLAVVESATEWGSWEKSNQFPSLFFRVMNFTEMGGESRWAIEFANEYEEEITFEFFCGAKGGYQAEKGWRMEGKLKPKARDIRGLEAPLASYLYMAIGAVRFGKQFKYQVSQAHNGISVLCAYCATREDDHCPFGERENNMSSYEDLCSEGADIPKSELEIIKNNRKKDAAYKKTRDYKEDAQMTGAVDAYTNAMTNLEGPNYLHKAFYIFGMSVLGFERLPLAATSNYTPNLLQHDASKHTGLGVGLQAGFFNDRSVSFTLTPQFGGFINAFSSGISGNHRFIGATGSMYLSTKPLAKLRLYLDLDYFSRSGEWKRDIDAENRAAGIITQSGEIISSEYSINTWRGIGGLQLRFLSDDTESWIKAGIGLQRFSGENYIDIQSMVYNLEFLVENELAFGCMMSKNYPQMGSLKSDVAPNGTYLSIYMVKNFDLSVLFK